MPGSGLGTGDPDVKQTDVGPELQQPVASWGGAEWGGQLSAPMTAKS